MATDPAFAVTPHIGVASVSVANTARDGSGTIVDVISAGLTGTRINELVLKATADPADSTVTFFLHNGAAWTIFDEWDLGDAAAGSTTVASYRERRVYDNLVLPSGWKLGAAITVSLTAGVIIVTALAGDF